MRVLIATVAQPKPGSFHAFCESLRLAAADNGLTVPVGIFYTTGKNGAFNLAFEVEGGSEECRMDFAAGVTMALMPARWCETDDALPETDTTTLEKEEA